MKLALACLLPTLLIAQERITEPEIRAHLAFLSDELLEGRGTGQRGGELALRYLETQLAMAGVRPLGTEGFRQAVPLEGLRMLAGASRVEVQGPNGVLPMDLEEDLACGSGLLRPQVKVDAPLVFVGHGIRDGVRDDFAGVDPRGKVLLFLVGDRPGTTAQSPCCRPENLHGRWSRKLELARELGAAGALVIHSDAGAGYGWAVARAGWQGERFQLPGGGASLGIQGWISGKASQRLFQAAGASLDSLQRAAETPGFRAWPLGLSIRGELNLRVRKLLQHNIVGFVPGVDPQLKEEAVLLSAHWDHLGRDEVSGEVIPGAVDNGTGCSALLGLARVFAQRSCRRSVVVFFPCAEEQGLLGSEAYVRAPRWPLARTVAALNLESLNPWGLTRDIGMLGLAGSGLEHWVREAAASAGLALAPSRPDPQGLFFRTDHFPFVKAGIPALSPGFTLDGGWDYLDPRQGAQAEAYLKSAYHRSADRFDPGWDLRGLVQQADFFETLVRSLGESVECPRKPEAPWTGASGLSR